LRLQQISGSATTHVGTPLIQSSSPRRINRRASSAPRAGVAPTASNDATTLSDEAGQVCPPGFKLAWAAQRGTDAEDASRKGLLETLILQELRDVCVEAVSVTVPVRTLAYPL